MLLLSAFLFLDDQEFKKNAVAVKAEIVEINTYREKRPTDDYYTTRHDVYVSYTYEDRQFEYVELNSWYAGMKVGNKVNILCNPNNPGSIRMAESANIALIIITSMGLIFLLTGVIPLIMNTVKEKRIKELLSNGIIISATITAIEENTFYSFNNAHPYQIVCTYGCYTFKSKNLWVNHVYSYAIGDTIDVVVNPQDYYQYFVQVREQ